MSEIIHGDNLKVLPTLDAASVALVVTSPPYGEQRDYKGYAWDFDAMLPALWRVMQKGGVVCWVVGDLYKNGGRRLMPERQALGFADAGWLIHDIVVWDKGSTPMQRAGCHQQEWEHVIIASKSRPRVCKPDMVPSTYAGQNKGDLKSYRDVDGTMRMRYNPGQVNATKRSGNVWRYRNGYGHSSRWAAVHEHPAVFPEALAARCIRTYSQEGDLVLDPFNGSGTTVAVARKLGRRWLGIDASAEYCALARRRLDETSDLLTDMSNEDDA